MQRLDFHSLLCAAVTVSVATCATTAQADPIAAAWGGGRAVVTNEEGFLPPGVVTEFGLTATIDSSGSAIGQFTCMVEQGGGGFTAEITGGEDLGGGCVVLTGTSTCIFPAFGVFFDEPITLIFWAGGPGTGEFVVCFDNFPEFGCEEETVINGVLKYHSPD